MTPKSKKIIISSLAIVILFVIYAVFIKSNPKVTLFVTGASISSQGQEDARILGAQIAQALVQIEKITLSKKIFGSEIYKSLKDRSQPINDEPMGRANPFAPIGDVSVKSSTRATTTNTTATSTKSQNATSTPGN